MGKNNEKGKKYEEFSKEILLLKNIKWDFEDTENISFDTYTNDHIIEGISGQKHQIDIHLTSSDNPQYHLLCECKAHDSAVEKTYACSYVTVIKDIQDKNKDWKIIPVFTARDGFQKGAKKILRYYRIIYLEMKDCRNITYTLTEETTIRSPILENMEGTLEDGTPVDNSAWFRNYSRGYNCGFQSIIRSFEVLDQNGKKIDNLNDYLGEFHTGKRVVQYDIDDEFLEEHSGKKLVGIKGTVTDHTTTKLGKTETKIKSSVVTRIKLGDGSVYRFDLDGSCYKMNDSDTDTTS